MGDLSKNFGRIEFTCHCGCGFDEPDPRLIEALQTLRDFIEAPIIVTSGCRCERHNMAVGGSNNSQHKLGKAADIHVTGVDSVFLAVEAGAIEAFREGGIGIYRKKGFVHVDVRSGRKRWFG